MASKPTAYQESTITTNSGHIAAGLSKWLGQQDSVETLAKQLEMVQEAYVSIHEANVRKCSQHLQLVGQSFVMFDGLSSSTSLVTVVKESGKHYFKLIVRTSVPLK